MAITPENIDITTLNQLPAGTLALANLIGQSDGSGLMSKVTITQLVSFIAPYVATIGASGYVGVSGLALPSPAGTNSFTLVGGPATYTHSGGNVSATGNLNILNWNGTVWSLASAIAIDFSTLVKNQVVPGSKNLFNKATATDFVYADYTTGNLQGLGTFFASDFIKVEPGLTYALSVGGVLSGDQMPFYDINKAYHSGRVSALSFTVPAGAHYVRVNSNLANKNTLQLEMGAVGTTYAAFTTSTIIDFPTYKGTVKYENLRRKTILVSKNGGDYDTIQAAVNASSGTIGNPQTILIFPGIYEEPVNTVGKYVSLIGTNKRDCIILRQDGNYYYPPLECSGGAYFENLYFKATSDVPDVHAINSYAVHMDFLGEGVAEFFNCIMESHQNSAMGIGLHQNQTLIINNCELKKFSDGSVYNGGALYFHNSPGAESGQKLIVKNSTIKADLGFSLVIDDARDNAGGVDIDTTVTFYNNMFYSDEFGKTTASYKMSNAPISGGISGKIKLTPDSYGNNIAIINA